MPNQVVVKSKDQNVLRAVENLVKHAPVHLKVEKHGKGSITFLDTSPASPQSAEEKPNGFAQEAMNLLERRFNIQSPEQPAPHKAGIVCIMISGMRHVPA